MHKYSLETDDNRLLRAALLDHCLIYGQFKLHSVGETDWLFDIHRILDTVIPLTRVTRAMDLRPPLAGIELGGYILALTAQGPGDPPILVRKDGTIYGAKEFRGQEVTLVDDVVTTGESMRQAITALTKVGIQVIRQVCVINRGHYSAIPLIFSDELQEYVIEHRPNPTQSSLKLPENSS